MQQIEIIKMYKFNGVLNLLGIWISKSNSILEIQTKNSNHYFPPLSLVAFPRYRPSASSPAPPLLLSPSQPSQARPNLTMQPTCSLSLSHPLMWVLAPPVRLPRESTILLARMLAHLTLSHPLHRTHAACTRAASTHLERCRRASSLSSSNATSRPHPICAPDLCMPLCSCAGAHCTRPHLFPLLPSIKATVKCVIVLTSLSSAFFPTFPFFFASGREEFVCTDHLRHWFR